MVVYCNVDMKKILAPGKELNEDIELKAGKYINLLISTGGFICEPPTAPLGSYSFQGSVFIWHSLLFTDLFIHSKTKIEQF